MSENQKCLNLIRGGGGSAIFKNVWNSKKSEISDGGGGQAYLGIFPKFFRFFFMMAPLISFITWSWYKFWSLLYYNLFILGDEDASSQKVNPDVWKSGTHV